MEVKNLLSGQNFLNTIQESFLKIPDHRRESSVEILLSDALLSAFALFNLKFPSLLQFEQEMKEIEKRDQLQCLYGVTRIPSDTQMREILDPMDPRELRKSFQGIFRCLQKGKVLEKFEFLDGEYLLSTDGTGTYYSDSIHCKNCMKKVHQRNNEKVTTYHHQMIAGCLVHPDSKQVIPFCPEAVVKQDGREKNDCELNAAKRFLNHFREAHPKLKVIFTGDALYGNLAFLEELEKHQMSYILGVKETGHGALFRSVKKFESLGRVEGFERKEIIGQKVKKEVIRRARWVNGVIFRYKDMRKTVNFYEYWEETKWIKKGKPTTKRVHFSWVTNKEITKNNIEKLIQGGRARWKIENETFNTLKNEGYKFEHNFGHGNKNLASNFATLMMLGFLFDQAQQIACKVFKKAKERKKRITYLWKEIQGLYQSHFVCFKSFAALIGYIANPENFKPIEIDST